MKPRAVLAALICAFLLTAAAPPVSPFRQDEAFWQMLTPAAREALGSVPVFVREDCGTFTGAVYHAPSNIIEFWRMLPIDELDRLRHEALHALDWSAGQRASDTSGFLEAVQ